MNANNDNKHKLLFLKCYKYISLPIDVITGWNKNKLRNIHSILKDDAIGRIPKQNW